MVNVIEIYLHPINMWTILTQEKNLRQGTRENTINLGENEIEIEPLFCRIRFILKNLLEAILWHITSQQFHLKGKKNYNYDVKIKHLIYIVSL